MAITKKRQAELIDIATTQLNDREWFDYHEWDGLIETDKELSERELTWLRNNVTITVTVTITKT